MWIKVVSDLLCTDGESLEQEVDLVVGQRNHWVGAYSVPEFVGHLNRCLITNGRSELVVNRTYTSVDEIKPLCGDLLTILRDWFEHGVARPKSRLERYTRKKDFLYLIEGLEHIQRAPAKDYSDGRGSILVHLSGNGDRIESVYEQIQALLRRAQVESLVELAQGTEIKISQSLMGEVVIIRNGIAERTPVRVDQDIKEALGDKRLSNEQGRKEATQWLSFEIPPSPSSCAQVIADGNPTS